MCNFLSAIVLKNGEIICKPEATNSHEDLIEFADLQDDTACPDEMAFARVEFLPPSSSESIKDLDKWKFCIDQSIVPTWFGDVENEVISKLKQIVSNIIIDKKKKILLGGCYILLDGAEIGIVKNCYIRAMYDSSRVDNMYDSSRVGTMYGSSQVGTMYGSSQVGNMYGSSQVGNMYDSSRVDNVMSDHPLPIHKGTR